MKNELKEKVNPNIFIVEGNTKLASSEDTGFLIFNLPAAKTCPYATDECHRICYARSDERFPHVVRSRGSNFEECKKQTFVTDMINNIEYHLSRKKYKNKHIYFRIHSSGDFWSQSYFDKFVEITNHFKDNDKITFVAYTKSLSYLDKHKLKDINIRILFSEMKDTKREDLEKAKRLGLKIFKAVDSFDGLGRIYKCKGNCGACKQCYEITGAKQIAVMYHGSRVSRKRKGKIIELPLKDNRYSQLSFAI